MSSACLVSLLDFRYHHSPLLLDHDDSINSAHYNICRFQFLLFLNMFILWNRTMGKTMTNGTPVLLDLLRLLVEKVMRPSLRIYPHTSGHTRLRGMVGITDSSVKTHLSFLLPSGNLSSYPQTGCSLGTR